MAAVPAPVVPRRASSGRRPLTLPTTEELHRYGLLVPPGCRLAKRWRVGKEELRNHHGGRYNIYGRHVFWDGKSYTDVINQHRPASTAAGNPVNHGGSQRCLRRRALTPSPRR
ncbi:hypothetical protein ZWY2020_012765 [Hordeum vulgare]|nr:hypothetical protein ZWY2020_012765 [Hordeum vulgare]